MELLAEPGSTALTLTMRYVRCGAGVSMVSLRTHRIMALGDEDLPAARQSGPSLRILRDWALLAAAGCFSCRQGCQAQPSGSGARQEGARAGLLANSGCFVSKYVLWCFVVFCGVLRVFCGVLRVFCGVLQVFCSISTKHTKHLKNIKKH